MVSGMNKTRALGLRAFVIFCALLSLCVSDTVGPRLLPLPGAVVTTTADRRYSKAPTSLQSPHAGTLP